MKVAIGADHRGLNLKSNLVSRVLSNGHEVEDVGAHRYDPGDDYPDFAKSVASLVSSGKVSKGILICGSGVGAAIASNKVVGARASICHDAFSVQQGVRHDDMNILCMGADVIGDELAFTLAELFLTAKFDPQPKYIRRLEKVISMEKGLIHE